MAPPHRLADSELFRIDALGRPIVAVVVGESVRIFENGVPRAFTQITAPGPTTVLDGVRLFGVESACFDKVKERVNPRGDVDQRAMQVLQSLANNFEGFDGTAASLAGIDLRLFGADAGTWPSQAPSPLT